MSVQQFLKCEKCGKMAKSDNHYEVGWIELDGELSRGTGKYLKKQGSFQSQWINASLEAKHFCSWECLQNYDDNNTGALKN